MLSRSLTGILFSLSVACGLAKQVQEHPFQVIGASGETVYAGISGAGKAKFYELKLLVDDKEIQFDSVWVNGLYLAPGIQQRSDTLLLQFGYTIPYPGQEESKDSIAYIPPPVDFEGEVLLLYSKGSARKYFPVTKEIQWSGSHRP